MATMKIELTIKTSYLPTWGAYEGIRELVQNGQDAKQEFGATFDVRYRKDTATLVLTNEGCTLPHEALLFGHTSKQERSDLIGKFGEGLKLGVLALVRSGHAIKIRSGSEVWTPAVERSDKFDADVLVFHIASGRENKNRVQVEIGNVGEEDWKSMGDHFLFLEPPKKNLAVKTGEGSLLLDSRYKGRVYVKGIFVQNVPTFAYGYDMQNADVDRDRKMVSSFDMEYRTQQIWRLAMAMRPDIIGLFCEGLENDIADLKGVDEWVAKGLDGAVRDEVAKRFAARHGVAAIPVGNIGESAELEHLGKRGILCHKGLRAVLESKLGNLQTAKAELAKETVKLYGWHELSADERANLQRAIALVGKVAPVTMLDVNVADFRDPKIQGLWRGSSARIEIAKRMLTDRKETLATIVHETAHKLGGGDGEKDHVSHIEGIWSAIVELMS
jgi:hypothetical protein